ISPDGQTVATTNLASQLRLWRVADGKLLGTFPLVSRLFLESITFRPEWHSLALVSKEQITLSQDGHNYYTSQNEIKIVRASDGALLRTIPLHHEYYTLAFSPDGQTIAGGGRVMRSSDDDDGVGVVSLWRVDTGELI